MDIFVYNMPDLVGSNFKLQMRHPYWFLSGVLLLTAETVLNTSVANQGLQPDLLSGGRAIAQAN